MAGIALTLAPAHASITYTCDSSITSNVNVPAGSCGILQTTIANLYNSTFSNANASIYVQLGPNSGGESQFLLGGLDYSTYKTDFTGESTDAAAVANIPGSEPDVTGDVFVTAAEADALGFNIEGGANSFGVLADGVTHCQLGTANCYNGVITIGGPLYFRSGGPIGGGQYDFYSIAQHETDEILGTASCLTFTGPSTPSAPTVDGCADINGSGISPTDLYRYSSPGVLAWIAAASDKGNLGAYFSVDGGNTTIATYHNGPDGGDYGDFTFQGTCGTDLVQDYAAISGCSPDITTDAGTPEIQLLNAVGFNLGQAQANTPEPGTIGLLGMGLTGLGVASYRRRKRAA